MKLKLITTFFCLCVSLLSKAAGPDHSNAFITIWDTSKMDAGTSLNIPSRGSNYQYYWEKVGDEENTNSSSYQTIAPGALFISIPEITAQSGIYKVYIKGGYNWIIMSSEPSSAKALTEVESWGNMAWTSMASAFRGCSNLTKLPTAAPDLSNVTDMSNMFYQATNFNHDIGNWNVSNVTNMSHMFRQATNFNQNIGSWNVSKVTDMRYMFFSARNFNQNISSWNVGNVINMTWMFSTASNFNQNISNWNVSKVTNMYNMFYSASAFNQNLGAWQLNANVDLENMLSYSGLNAENYGLILKGWAEQNTIPTGRTLDAVNLKYNTNAQQYRDILTNNKNWTINDGGVLPVTLISFTAKTQANAVKINWQTAAESNNSHFIIEKSTDGINFQYLIRAEAKGAGIYEVYDKYPSNGNNYYRLTQFDKDGTAENHGVQAVNFSIDAATTVKVYPNPAVSNVTTTVSFPVGIYNQVVITDIKGKTINTTLIGKQQEKISLETADLQQGIYFIRLSGQENTVKKLIKQ